MKFPRRYHALKKIFLNACDPDIAALKGEYIVDILSFLPSLKRFNHRKVFHAGENNITGHNVLFGKTWGTFSVSESNDKESGFKKSLMLNYDMEDNFFLLRNIRDYMRSNENDTWYIGKFYFRFFRWDFFIGYFSLEKIK